MKKILLVLATISLSNESIMANTIECKTDDNIINIEEHGFEPKPCIAHFSNMYFMSLQIGFSSDTAAELAGIIYRECLEGDLGVIK